MKGNGLEKLNLVQITLLLHMPHNVAAQCFVLRNFERLVQLMRSERPEQPMNAMVAEMNRCGIPGGVIDIVRALREVCFCI